MITHFAKANYESVIYINFALEKKYMQILAYEYNVICSGSILGINYKKIHSNSVGSNTDYKMIRWILKNSFGLKGIKWSTCSTRTN